VKSSLVFSLAHFVLHWQTAAGEHPPCDRAAFKQHSNGSQSEEAYRANAQELRRFLWEHWLPRVCGKATVTLSTVEGDGGETTYNVQPDEKGVWRIAVQLEGSETDFAQETSRHRSEHWEVYTVQRVKIPKNMDERLSRRVLIPGNARLSPTKYHLVLRDKGGELREQL
jgi:hypothetical protein